MLRVGLTGGIGSGKSTVADMLRHRGAVLVDSDHLARQVVAPGTEGLALVVAEFGEGVLTASGDLDRPRVAAVVFGDEGARRRLEGIIHPRVRAAAREQESQAVAADPGAVVVHDVPLLVETGRHRGFDVVAVVDVPEEVAVQRLVTHRDLDPADARRRILAQASRADRLAVADVVLDNSGSLQSLRDQVDAAWRDWLRQARA
jgi:dephospho-CoA kinase